MKPASILFSLAMMSLINGIIYRSAQEAIKDWSLVAFLQLNLKKSEIIDTPQEYLPHLQ